MKRTVLLGFIALLGLYGCQHPPSATVIPEAVVVDPEQAYIAILHDALSAVGRVSGGEQSAFEEIPLLAKRLGGLYQQTESTKRKVDIENLLKVLGSVQLLQADIAALFDAKARVQAHFSDMQKAYQQLAERLEQSENTEEISQGLLCRQQAGRLHTLSKNLDVILAGTPQARSASKQFNQELDYFGSFLQTQRFGDDDEPVFKRDSDVVAISSIHGEFNRLLKQLDRIQQHSQSLGEVRLAVNTLLTKTDHYIEAFK